MQTREKLRALLVRFAENRSEQEKLLVEIASYRKKCNTCHCQLLPDEMCQCWGYRLRRPDLPETGEND